MDDIMRFFEYDHLRADLQEIAAEFYHLASWIEEELPSSAERTVALRKLLESKDAAVRAAL